MGNKQSFSESDYEQRYVPNWRRMARLLNDAKGPNRTMARFAEECKVSPVTFSRVINGRYKKPLSFDVIKAIYDNAYNQGDIRFDSLMMANGFDNISKEQEMMQRSDEEFKKEQDLQNFIKIKLQAEFISRGKNVTLYSKLPESINKNSRPGLDIDEYEINHMMGIQGEDSVWCFIYSPFFHLHDDKKRNRLYWRENLMRRWGKFFLKDAWESEKLSNVVFCFLFFEKSYYDKFLKEVIYDVKVNSHMRVALMDYENGKILKETMIPRYDGKVLKGILK